MVNIVDACKLAEAVAEDIKKELELVSNYTNSAEALKERDPFAAGLYLALAADEQRHRNVLDLIRKGYQDQCEGKGL